MKFSRDVVQKIRDKVDMVELVSGYTRLEQRGNRWWGLSPFKTEKTPSFSVKPEQGLYYCFATQKGGDIFRFVSEMEGLSFPEAVEFLAERAGIPIETTAEDDAAERERRSIRELYERVTKTFRFLLESDPRGRDTVAYARTRGLNDDLRERFEIGYAVDDGRWLYRFLRSKSYSPAFLERCGLFSKRNREYALFRNRLIFPIRDERKRVVAFGGRALSDSEKAKYINSPETPIFFKKRTLYGVHLAGDAMRRTRTVHLAEGYMDVIALHGAGVSNSVAPLGTAFTEEQARLLTRWVKTVRFVFDADQAGIDATLRGAIVAEKAGLECEVVPVPSGKDPAELFVRDGAEAVSDMVSHSIPAFTFLLEKSVQQTPPRDVGSRDLLLRKLFPYINIVGSEVRREALVRELSDAIGVSTTAVNADLESWRKGEQSHRVAESTTTTEKKKTSRDMKLMLATAHDGELFAYLRRKIAGEEIDDGEARRLFYYMEDAFRHGETLPRGLIDRITEEGLRDFVLDRLTSEEFSGWSRDDIDRALRFLEIRKLTGRQRELERALQRIDTADLQEIRRVQEQKMAVDQELAMLKVRVDD